MKKIALVVFFIFSMGLFAQSGLGIWQIGTFVDEWGDPTDIKYIVNRSWIRGTFTTNLTNRERPLNVRFIYTSSMGLGIELHEQESAQPTIIYATQISLSIQDRNGERTTLAGVLSSDATRIFIRDDEARQKMTEILNMGGNIRFRITCGMSIAGSRQSTYIFDISNADGFAAAYSEL